jgi:hypothetical protein
MLPFEMEKNHRAFVHSHDKDFMEAMPANLALAFTYTAALDSYLL